jgi:anthranilate phosphoribosyltransferase
MSDMDALKPFLARISLGQSLSEAEAVDAFDVMMSGAATQAQIGAFLMGLRVRGETIDEITGAARIMRTKAATISAPEGAIDTCGTGGDGKGSLNISTAVALVVAACGVPVAKHGNRAASSKSGAADVLEALGVNVMAELDQVEACLQQHNVCFLMAPRHHAAMKHVVGPRKELGVRTVFNLLGPLANPAGTKRQLMGVFSDEWLEPIARVLGRLGSEAAWVVHGSDGLDELTVTGPSEVAELKNGVVQRFRIHPEDADIKPSDGRGLIGGSPADNAKALEALLSGKTGPYRDIVVLNAAAALIVAGRAGDLRSGAAYAREALDTGRAAEKLVALVKATNTPANAEVTA